MNSEYNYIEELKGGTGAGLVAWQGALQRAHPFHPAGQHATDARGARRLATPGGGIQVP